MTTDAKEAMTVPKKEQNAGVALLLERIKTHPEEFLDEGKWGTLINRYERYFSEEDAKALSNAIDGLMQQRFTEKVLEELVYPKSDNWADNVMKSKGITSAGTTPGGFLGVRNTGAVTGAVSVGGTWGTSPYTTKEVLEAQKYQTEQMRAHLDAHREFIKTTPVKKPHKTLFGKLFNYT